MERADHLPPSTLALEGWLEAMEYRLACAVLESDSANLRRIPLLAAQPRGLHFVQSPLGSDGSEVLAQTLRLRAGTTRGGAATAGTAGPRRMDPVLVHISPSVIPLMLRGGCPQAIAQSTVHLSLANALDRPESPLSWNEWGFWHVTRARATLGFHGGRIVAPPPGNHAWAYPPCVVWFDLGDHGSSPECLAAVRPVVGVLQAMLRRASGTSDLALIEAKSSPGLDLEHGQDVHSEHRDASVDAHATAHEASQAEAQDYPTVLLHASGLVNWRAAVPSAPPSTDCAPPPPSVLFLDDSECSGERLLRGMLRPDSDATSRPGADAGELSTFEAEALARAVRLTGGRTLFARELLAHASVDHDPGPSPDQSPSACLSRGCAAFEAAAVSRLAGLVAAGDGYPARWQVLERLCAPPQEAWVQPVDVAVDARCEARGERRRRPGAAPSADVQEVLDATVVDGVGDGGRCLVEAQAELRSLLSEGLVEVLPAAGAVALAALPDLSSGPSMGPARAAPGDPTPPAFVVAVPPPVAAAFAVLRAAPSHAGLRDRVRHRLGVARLAVDAVRLDEDAAGAWADWMAHEAAAARVAAAVLTDEDALAAELAVLGAERAILQAAYAIRRRREVLAKAARSLEAEGRALRAHAAAASDEGLTGPLRASVSGAEHEGAFDGASLPDSHAHAEDVVIDEVLGAMNARFQRVSSAAPDLLQAKRRSWWRVWSVK